jgi:Poly-beta-hydroxybutyrate polymerase (PhaC) N-terminus
MFSFRKESYLVAAKSILSSVRGVRDLDPDTAKKADFYTRHFVDAISPSNFIAKSACLNLLSLFPGDGSSPRPRSIRSAVFCQR